MSDVKDHDVIEVKREEKRLVLPDGYEFRGEVDIEEIKIALEQFADKLANAG